MRIGFIGGGNMARAIVGGALRAGRLRVEDVLVSEPDEARRQALAEINVRAVWDNAAVAADCDLLVLAVKPQKMDEALASICSSLDAARTLLVSIAAGKRIATLEFQLPPGARVVRVMPNTPLLVGKGMSVLCGGTHATPQDLERAVRLFAASGETLVLEERHFDAVTAVSGSGPAYFFRLAEALQDAACEAGLPEAAAKQLACQTCIGAARLLEESPLPPEELRRQVTSPGGTTEAALQVLEAWGFGNLLSHAVAAAVKRGRELSET